MSFLEKLQCCAKESLEMWRCEIVCRVVSGMKSFTEQAYNDTVIYSFAQLCAVLPEKNMLFNRKLKSA